MTKKFFPKCLTNWHNGSILYLEIKKEVLGMTKYNLWKSIYTNEIYKMPIDWLPKFDGWELIKTIEE